MITQILEFIKSMGTAAACWVVVDPWQGGVILRLGKFHRELGVGLHWKWPVIDTAIVQNVAITTTSLSAQSIVTPEGPVYTVEGVVKWSVADIQPFTCSIWDSENVIIDSAKSAIAEIISKQGVHDIGSKVTSKTRIALKKYGIAVDTVTITTLAPVMCLRLIYGSSPPPVMDSL